jgi:hypothetical protein
MKESQRMKNIAGKMVTVKTHTAGDRIHAMGKPIPVNSRAIKTMYGAGRR